MNTIEWEELTLYSESNFDEYLPKPKFKSASQGHKQAVYVVSLVHEINDDKSYINALKDIYHQKIDNTNIVGNYPIIFLDERVPEEDGTLFYPRSKDYMESSIWNYFLDTSKKDRQERMEWILQDIKRNYDEHRYDLKVTQEFAEFRSRLCHENYLKTGEHAKYVSPFLFHSERKMKERVLNDRCDKIPLKDFLLKYKWRILLLDDQWEKNMSGSNDKEYPTKQEIIENDLQRIFGDQWRDHVEILGEKTIDGALGKIKGGRYDLILLDYKLLDYLSDEKLLEKKDSEGNPKRAEYGYELLEELKKDIDNKPKRNEQIDYIGPNGQFYFMFISAYPTAVDQRLRNEGLFRLTDYWYIGQSACPTNTPYLFIYTLLNLMSKRVKSLQTHSDMLIKDLGEENAPEETYTTLVDFLSKLYKGGDNEQSIRTKCAKGFNALLTIRKTYSIIKDDVKGNKEKSSLLIESMFPDVHCYNNAFWEHLQNLVYLTAYGSVLQWPEMWEEYNFIQHRLEVAEQKCSKDKQLSSLIRDYILIIKKDTL